VEALSLLSTIKVNFKVWLLLLLIFLIGHIYGQEKAEQVYLTLCDRMGIEVEKPFNFQPLNTGKCGFGLYVEVGRNWDKFNEIQKRT
jgi:hypothetical protein